MAERVEDDVGWNATRFRHKRRQRHLFPRHVANVHEVEPQAFHPTGYDRDIIISVTDSFLFAASSSEAALNPRRCARRFDR